MSWRDLAVCHPDRRPDHLTPAEWTAIWFPEGEVGVGDNVDPSAPARAICADCPVQHDCREASAGEQGIWAGVNLDKPKPGVGEKECRTCGRIWAPRWRNVVYCSVACQEEGARARSRESSRRYQRRHRRQYVCSRCGMDFGEDVRAWRTHEQASVWYGGCAA